MKGAKMKDHSDFTWGMVTGFMFALVVAIAWQQI